MPNPEPAAPAPRPGIGNLFFAFFQISVMDFGGVMPWARWMTVEKRGWLSSHEFNEAMALCQFLPGGNIVNFGVIVGSRFCGLAGGAAAVFGLMVAPFGIVLMLATIYTRYESVPAVAQTLNGISAGAAGLVAAMALKMVMSMRGEWVALTAAAAAFVAVGVFRVPLLVAVAVLSPLTIAYAWRRIT